jgi:hypothetical protein
MVQMDKKTYFEVVYQEFLQKHLINRTGENLRRLQQGLGHAEKMFLEHVWWPAFGHFDHLYPEFEIKDFKDGLRYLDFAFLRPPFRACFEIDGYGPHWHDINRGQFADHLMRQNHLILDGWTVIRFSYEDIKDRPRRCQQIVQQWAGRFLGEREEWTELPALEKEILRYTIKQNTPLTSSDVCQLLSIERRYARKLLGRLVDKKFLVEASGVQRVRTFRLHEKHASFHLF